jgi:hypothetical protein
MVLINWKFGTDDGTTLLKSKRMKYQSRIIFLFWIPAISTSMRKISATKRKKDVSRAQVLRVRVARLICFFESSVVGTSVTTVEGCSTTTVSSEARRRLKKRILVSFVEVEME